MRLLLLFLLQWYPIYQMPIKPLSVTHATLSQLTLDLHLNPTPDIPLLQTLAILVTQNESTSQTADIQYTQPKTGPTIPTTLSRPNGLSIDLLHRTTMNTQLEQGLVGSVLY